MFDLAPMIEAMIFASPQPLTEKAIHTAFKEQGLQVRPALIRESVERLL